MLTAQEFVSVIDTYSYDQRWYAANIAQFLSADPIDADMQNTYRAFGNSPTNYTDPDGLRPTFRGRFGVNSVRFRLLKSALTPRLITSSGKPVGFTAGG